MISKPRGEAAAGGAEVRVEALPLSEDEAWFSLRWRGEPSDNPKGPAPQFEIAMRLKTGRGAMVMSPQGQQAVVLWVRFAFMRNAEPADERNSQGKGKEPGK